MYEELFHESEDLKHTRHDKILLSKHRAVVWDDLDDKIEQIEKACEVYDESGIRSIILMLVPEWHEKSADIKPRVIQNGNHGASDEQKTLH